MKDISIDSPSGGKILQKNHVVLSLFTADL